MEWFLYNIRQLSQADADRCTAWMTPERRAQVLRLRQETARRATIAAEWYTKNLLAERCDLPAEKITLLRTDRGKPYADLPLQFNWSHSGEWVAVTLNSKAVGVDIEVLRPIDLKVTRRIYTPADQAYAQSGDPTQRFFEIWTAKEAYFKYLGTGITDLLSVSYRDLTPLHFYRDNCIVTIIKSL